MSKTSELLDYLHACLPNITGVGHAYKVTQGKRTKQFGLTITVRKKLPKYMLSKKERIPPEIDGEPTDVVEAEFNALHLLKELPRIKAGGDSRTDKWRPAPGGVSVGHPQVTAGTLGGWLYYGSDIVMLSNNHILANCNDAEVGDSIYQPGVYDGGTVEDRIGHLLKWTTIDFDIAGENVCDAAIAKPDDIADVDWQILGITTSPIGYKLDATVGMPVTKSGRTTKVTSGEITSVDWSGYVNYGTPGVAKFVDQIWIPTPGFIAGGDSGSWLLQDKEGATPDTIVGLVFAGNTAGMCIANPINPILDNLGISVGIPAALEGYVYLAGGIITGAYVICYNPTWDELFVVTTDSNGKYSFPEVGYLNQTLLVSCHFSNEKVYQAGCYKKLQSDPETLNLTLEEYDAVADGKEVNFIFTGGGGWEQLDLYLEQYKSVWA